MQIKRLIDFVRSHRENPSGLFSKGYSIQSLLNSFGELCSKSVVKLGFASFFVFGVLFFMFYHGLVVVSFPCWFYRAPVSQAVTYKKKVVISFWADQQWKQEEVESIWDATDARQQLEYLTNRWLMVCEEEKGILKKITLQSVLLSADEHEAFVSFDRNPLDKQGATYDNLMLVEGLLKTIRENGIPIDKIRLLVHHQQLDDEHLDFSFSWPVSGFASDGFTLPADMSKSNSGWFDVFAQKTYTIMLDPAGDAKHAGRTIDDTFERGITLACAQRIKKTFESKGHRVNVVLTRLPGETLDALDTVTYANRLNVDLYLSLHFYYAPERAPSLAVFQYVQQPTDLWGVRYQPLSLVAYDQVHLINSVQSASFRLMMVEFLRKELSLHTLSIAAPFLPLKGIKSPALGVEIGLQSKMDWQHYVDPLATIIHQLLV